LNALVDGSDIKYVMLDLGLDANILPKKYWEVMRKPKLVYSSIQLCLANQYRIFPIGWWENVEVDLARVIKITNFKVIEIMNEWDPYLALLGIVWAFENNDAINPKK
jgi:hypothetical protein